MANNEVNIFDINHDCLAINNNSLKCVVLSYDIIRIFFIFTIYIQYELYMGEFPDKDDKDHLVFNKCNAI